MSRVALALKYRPKTFADVAEQSAVKKILSNQIETATFKNSYLFCGAAGTGKTTCARIFADMINHGEGNPIEMDAASNSGVGDVRNIANLAKLRSLDSEYKIFIIDECHAISNTGWQAFLKLIEEPPLNTVFIFCTTDPQKIPKTILSRVQRFDFQRITIDGIIRRLNEIIQQENLSVDKGAIDRIAILADGGMRDALTLLDKCLSYKSELTLQDVDAVLGLVTYDVMIELTNSIQRVNSIRIVEIIDKIYNSGLDLKRFVRDYINFVLDMVRSGLGYTTTQSTCEMVSVDLYHLLDTLIKLNNDIKWDTSPKMLIEATLLLEAEYVRTK